MRWRVADERSKGSWGIAPARPRASAGEVHIWRAFLDLPPHRVDKLARTLSPDEIRRAEHLFFAVDRLRFTVARGVLRAILGSYLDTPASDITFCYGPHGKPALPPEFDEGRLHFNVAHSFGLALYAVARDREVGVDVEWMRPHLANTGVAERFFAPAEVETLEALPEDGRGEAFYRCWTRKEAYIKARGEGLSLPLDQFDVSLAVDERPVRLRTHQDPFEAERWRLWALQPAQGYAAAVAVEGLGWRLRRWTWVPVRRRVTSR